MRSVKAAEKIDESWKMPPKIRGKSFKVPSIIIYHSHFVLLPWSLWWLMVAPGLVPSSFRLSLRPSESQRMGGSRKGRGMGS
jgi:hypothetical protein